MILKKLWLSVSRRNSDYAKRIAKDPLNAELHLRYATDAMRIGKSYLAFAELKTAEFLGAASTRTAHAKRQALAAMPRPETMGHNVYFRLISLASELIDRSGRRDFSVLDVGGGEGPLASFIPDASYFLVDPSSNGISGMDLPFAAEAFDYVVSCHVLEHIPAVNRVAFLDQLLSKSRYGVILLNPFFVTGTSEKERLQLFVDITNSQWAKEHLECDLPVLEDIRSFAEQRNLRFAVKPNGTMTTTIAIEFMNYFAGKARLKGAATRINEFYNVAFGHLLDSPDYPVAYLVYIDKTEIKSVD